MSWVRGAAVTQANTADREVIDELLNLHRADTPTAPNLGLVSTAGAAPLEVWS